MTTTAKKPRAAKLPGVVVARESLDPFDPEPEPATVREMMKRLTREPGAIFVTPFARAFSLLESAWDQGWTFKPGYEDSVIVSKGGGEYKVTNLRCGCYNGAFCKSHKVLIDFAGGPKLCSLVARQFPYLGKESLVDKLEATLAQLEENREPLK